MQPQHAYPFEIAQDIEGSRRPAKRIETKRTEELVGEGPQTDIAPSTTTTYYVRSSLTGGDSIPTVCQTTITPQQWLAR